MAVTAPTSATILDATTYQTPAVDGETVAQILENGNHLYRDWQVPLVDACPCTRTDANDRSYTVPVTPSADGLRYQFRFTWLPQFNGTVTLAVYEAASFAGTFNVVAGPTVTAVGAIGVWQAATLTGTVPATARCLRFRITAAGGSFYPGQIRAAPNPNTSAVPFVAPFGTTASGFRVFDDSLLRTAGAPVNTEMLDRALLNARSVIRDRLQAVFSFVQDDGTLRNPIYRPPFTGAPPPSTALEMRLGATPCYIPHDGDAWIDVRVIALTTAAVTAGRVRVSSDEAGETLAANGTIQTARLKVKGPRFNVYLYASSQTALDTTYVYAAVGLWRPGDTA